MARSNEPLWWAPFFAGAGLSALFMPITIFLTSIAVVGGKMTEDKLIRLLSHPLTKLYLFALISLSLFHAVHRIRFVLVDFGLKSIRTPISFLCYGFAMVGSLAAFVLLLRM